MSYRTLVDNFLGSKFDFLWGTPGAAIRPSKKRSTAARRTLTTAPASLLVWTPEGKTPDPPPVPRASRRPHRRNKRPTVHARQHINNNHAPPDQRR